MPIELIAVLGTYLMCWQGYRMRRKVSGMGHIALVLSLVGTLANSTSARVRGLHPHTALTSQYLDLLAHIFVVISCAGLYVFRLSVQGQGQRTPRVDRTIGGALAISSLFTVITLIDVQRGRTLSVSVATFRDPLGFVYHFAGGVYFGMTMLLIARWMVRYTRDEPDKHFKLGMRVVATALFALSALCLGRAAPVAIVFLGGPPVLAPPVLLGAVTAAVFPTVFLGLSWPLLVSRLTAYRVWRRQERVRAQVSVVWKACVTAYPEIALRPGSLFEQLRQALWKPHKMRRQRTETFDALTKLLFGSPAREVAEPGATAADTLRAAVRLYDATHSRTVRDVISPDAGQHDEGIPAQPDTDESTGMLIDLAQLMTVYQDDLAPTT